MVPLIRRFTRLRRDETGTELVEAALTFPLVLLVVLGILDFGLLFQQYEVITNAAREGARVAVLPDYSAADAEARARQYIGNALLARDANTVTNVAVGAPTPVVIGGKCMKTVTVTVTYPHEFLYVGGIAHYFDPNASFGTKTLTAASTMRTEEIAGTCP